MQDLDCEHEIHLVYLRKRQQEKWKPRNRWTQMDRHKLLLLTTCTGAHHTPTFQHCGAFFKQPQYNARLHNWSSVDIDTHGTAVQQASHSSLVSFIIQGSACLPLQTSSRSYTAVLLPEAGPPPTPATHTHQHLESCVIFLLYTTLSTLCMMQSSAQTSSRSVTMPFC